MKTAIVTIGDEILIGQIVDTNSAWIAHRMTDAGFEIEEMASIGDNAQQIKDTITDVFRRVDVILMTGGIGPTKDDITKNTLCEYFGTSLIFDDNVLDNIKEVISNRTTLNELTRNQAYVPKDAIIIQNKVGTAPITWFEKNGKTLVSMPGVPYEMVYNMENEIIPRLHLKYDVDAYLSRTFIIGGYSESQLAITLEDFENNLPEGFGLAYLPSPAVIRLRLFIRGKNNMDKLDEQAKKLVGIIGNDVIAEKDIPIEKLLGERLFEQGLSLGTAESCTGGNIAHRITSVPGSSRYYKGSVVSYSNEVKAGILNVSESDIEKYGVVSEQVVIEMAKGAQRTLGCDCSIATSGVAGPDGGTSDKPVGTVWIATACKDKVVAYRYQVGKYRESNIMRASTIGMLQLLKML